MHILILPMYYPEPGAPPHRGYMFREQAVQIARTGCQTGLVYVEQRLLKELSWKTFWQENHFQVTEDESEHVVTLRMHAWNPKLSTRIGAIIWSLLTLRLVGIYIRRHGKPDLIHAHFGTWAGYAARLAYKCYGIPYIVTEQASSINGGKVTPGQATTLRTAYKDARKIICVGTQLKQNLTPYLDRPDKAIVIPNFVDISTFRPNGKQTEKEKSFTFVSVGNLSRRKGFAELINAFARHFSDKPHVSLVIAGDGEEEDNLRQQIHGLHLEGQISLAGRLPREEVADLLARSDAFVLASYAETFGIVFIEAMAAGLPAIGTVCGGPEDIITPESGYLIRPGDVQALGQKMQELYEHYEQFDKVAIRRSVAERFDFSQAGQKLLKVYQEAIQGYE